MTSTLESCGNPLTELVVKRFDEVIIEQLKQAILFSPFLLIKQMMMLN